MTDLWVYIIVIILNGFTGGGVAAMLWASCSEVVPSHLISGATAALACSQSVGMFLGSMFMGNVIAAIGYAMAGWVVLVACCHLRPAWQAEVRQNCPGDFCLVWAPPDYRGRLFRVWS